MSELVEFDLCAVCSRLNLSRVDFENAPFELEERYGSVVVADTLQALRARQSQCKLCRLILRALRQNQRGEDDLDTFPGSVRWQVVWRQSTDEYDLHGDDEQEWYGCALYPSLQDVPGCRADYSVQLVDDIDTKGFLRGRVVLPDANIHLISSWLVKCEAEHGPDCTSPSLWVAEPPRDVLESLYVVDVQQQCIVPLPPNTRYAALSYVWGQSAWARMDSSNFERFKQPGTISHTAVPRTVSDSMSVVSALGCSYLWVDFLCIEQNPIAKQQAIQNMDAIFCHAYMCIVAASGGDAESGLSGWSYNSRSKHSVGASELIKDDLRLGVLQVIDAEMMECEHAQRAWTFQEGVLSPRRIVFLNGFVHYACRCAIWREDMHEEAGDLVKPSQRADVLGREPENIPLRRFSQYINNYTNRKLTFSADVMNAFAGMQRAMSGSMNHTKIWFGMPASVFDWALLWSAGQGVRIERRSGFPSASWMGWSGYIVMALDHFSEVDQAWLQGRTWIDWYVFDESSHCVMLWNPERDATLRNDIVVTEEDVFGHLDVDDDDDDDDDDEDEANLQQTQHDEQTENDDSDGGIETILDFPQYGWPTPGNPYGRFSSTHELPLRDQTFTPSLNAPPGTLYFATVVATFALRIQALALTNQLSYFTLEDKLGRSCGVIWDDGLISNIDLVEQSLFDVLILSEAAPGTIIPFKALSIPDDGVYSNDIFGSHSTERILGAKHTWNMYNVMLVSRAEGIGDNTGVSTNSSKDNVYE